jgi:hypothetical protein
VTHALKQGRVGRPAMARFWQRQAVDERGARVRRGVARAWRGPSLGKWSVAWLMGEWKMSPAQSSSATFELI